MFYTISPSSFFLLLFDSLKCFPVASTSYICAPKCLSFLVDLALLFAFDEAFKICLRFAGGDRWPLERKVFHQSRHLYRFLIYLNGYVKKSTSQWWRRRTKTRKRDRVWGNKRNKWNILVEKRRLARDPLASFPLLFTQREAHARKKCHLVGKRKLSTKKKGTHKKEGEALCCFLLQNKSWCVFALYRQKEKEIRERRFSQTIKSLSIWKKKVNVFSCGRKKKWKRFYLKKGNVNWRYDFPPSQPNIRPPLKIAEEKKSKKTNGSLTIIFSFVYISIKFFFISCKAKRGNNSWLLVYDGGVCVFSDYGCTIITHNTKTFCFFFLLLRF